MIQTALIPLALAAASVSAEDDVHCAVSFATHFVGRFAELPEEIRNDVLKDGKIAEPDGAFNETDDIDDRNLPFRRLVRAGRSGGQWFVWIKHGGFSPHYDVLGFRPFWEKADRYRWYRAGEFQGEPCIAINAFLAGVQTPTDGRH